MTALPEDPPGWVPVERRWLDWRPEASGPRSSLRAGAPVGGGVRGRRHGHDPRAFDTTDGPEAILGDFEAISDESKSRPDFTVSGGRAPVAAVGGIAGVTESYSGAGTEGLIAVFTFAAKDVAVAVEVDAPQGQLASAQPEVRQMLRSH